MDVTFLEHEFFFQEPGPYSSLQREISSKEENMCNDHGSDDQSCFSDTNATSMNLTNIINMPHAELMKDMGDDAGDTGEIRNEEMSLAENNDIEDVQEKPPPVPVSTNLPSSENTFEVQSLKDFFF